MTANFKLNKWRRELWGVRRSFLVALVLLGVALLIYSFAGDYVSDIKLTATSPDLILDHFGPYDFSFVFVWLYILVIAVYFVYPLFYKPKMLPYALNIFSLLIAVRSGFIIFTHLRPPADAIHIVFPAIFQAINWSNDMFFSGHVAFAFLGYLVFRKVNWIIGSFMFVASIILGIVVLAMHVHYSIDVFSAFFITYCVYEVSNRLIQFMKIRE